jgi:protein-disulfide isomerase
MKRYLTIIIIIVGLIGGTLSGLWLSRLRSFEAALDNPEPIRNLSEASAGAASPQSKGSETARVTVEEFADFQCPPCAALHDEIKKIEREFSPGQVRFVFRHYPLDMHEQAMLAAQISEAAALQGKFWEMQNLIYEKQQEWSEKSNAAEIFDDYARSLNLDMEKFRGDINNTQIKERIEADKKRGESINLGGTPSLFINGREVSSESMTSDGIRNAIKAALH